ncbi:MAG: HAMP domain-containing histidine kinase [Bryobacterales bacterium]|nr:HAMP domain-containing histidine kinase [Bryobacterales bacterium]
MTFDKNRRQALLSWLFVGLLIVLSVCLGALQYVWIGEVSQAERDRLRAGLQTSLTRLSQDFNSSLTVAVAALIPDHYLPRRDDRLQDYASRFLNWRDGSPHGHILRSLSIVIPSDGGLQLRRLNFETRELDNAPWPAEWAKLQQRFLARLSGERRGPMGFSEDYPDLIEIPYFAPGGFETRRRNDAPGMPARGPEPGFGPPLIAEAEWLLIEVDREYIRSSLIPELQRRHLATDGVIDYDAEIVLADNPSNVVYRSAKGPIQKPDASVRLFEIRFDTIMRRAMAARGPGPRGAREGGPGRPQVKGPERPDARDRFGGGGMRGMGRGRGPEMAGDRGRWLLNVRHNTGSLEAVVEHARRRNLAVAMAILFLLLAAVTALIVYTRRAQALANLQMQFVAGVSHELRTPLSVMRTAGHNLQGRVSADPSRVQRYGELIEHEAEKLGAIVEQVLRFANVKAGRVIGATESVPLAAIVERALAADRRLLEESGCRIEKDIPLDLPMVIGDPSTLEHAVRNLISNAAKYGRAGGWIGISVRDVSRPEAIERRSGLEVELRVADRGEGIPQEELNQIFEPFYRGSRATETQIHGTGLGLTLVKRIVEAHGGVIAARSEPGKGTEVLVRLPAAPVERHEFADSIS